MISRRHGALPLGYGRASVPLDDVPTPAWMDALRAALGRHRPEDVVWQYAVENVTSDVVDEVPHLMFLSGRHSGADFLAIYVRPIEAAIDLANAAAS